MIRIVVVVASFAILLTFAVAASMGVTRSRVHIVVADGSVAAATPMALQVFALDTVGAVDPTEVVVEVSGRRVPLDAAGRALVAPHGDAVVVDGEALALSNKRMPGFALRRPERQNLVHPGAGATVYLPNGAHRARAFDVVLVDDAGCTLVPMPPGAGTLPDGRLLAMTASPVTLTTTSAVVAPGARWAVGVGGRPRGSAVADIVIDGSVVARPIVTLDEEGRGVIDVDVPAVAGGTLVVVGVAESNTPGASQTVLTTLVAPADAVLDAIEPRRALCSDAVRERLDRGLVALIEPARTVAPVVSRAPAEQRRVSLDRARQDAARGRFWFRVVVLVAALTTIVVAFVTRGRRERGVDDSLDADDVPISTPARFWPVVVVLSVVAMLGGLDLMLGLLAPGQH